MVGHIIGPRVDIPPHDRAEINASGRIPTGAKLLPMLGSKKITAERSLACPPTSQSPIGQLLGKDGFVARSEADSRSGTYAENVDET